MTEATSGHPVATAFKEMMEFQARGGESFWEGTSTELLETLGERIDERTHKAKAWPDSARGLSATLRRLAPNLGALGLIS